jgi:uroporphyrinogen-III decarboxylase
VAERITPGPPLSDEAIDAWIENDLDGQTLTEQFVIESGMYEHVRGLAERLGEEFMIFPNQGAPGSGFPWLSWEDQMLLIQQQPALVRHYVDRDCQRFLTRVRATRALGADGYIFSEGYCGVCDILSPALFNEVFLEPKRRFYEQVRASGMLGIGYFLGGIEPYLDTVNAMHVDGVLLEENKLRFTLDPVEIRKKLDPRAVLFGNLDSQLLLNGPPQAIRQEVRRQAQARDYGPFAIANGSPICPHTPPENLTTFIEAARESR